uniref:Signal transducing adaptor family member 1 n=1 Tax=Chrysemys picta bellii TaxID=8478 RepID=A0A8C3IB58_CHRPI
LMAEKIPEPAPRRIFQERQRITALPLYFEGFLSIRRAQYQDFEQYWTELRGTTLFFYSDKKTPTVSSKTCLEYLVLESLLGFYFLFSQVEDYDSGEEWKGFILTVTQVGKLFSAGSQQMVNCMVNCLITLELSVFMLLLSSLLCRCFYAVSRQKAIEMLEKNPSWGNLILRPGSDSKNYSVTIRQVIDGPSIKHYRVVNMGKGYTIELARPVSGCFLVGDIKPCLGSVLESGKEYGKVEQKKAGICLVHRF